MLLLCLLVAVPAFLGWHLRPQLQEAPPVVEPSVYVAANQPGVAATVDLDLAVGLGKTRRSSQLKITLVATSKVSGPVTLTLALYAFRKGTRSAAGTPALTSVGPPAASSLLGSLPLAATIHLTNYHDYEVSVPITARHPVGVITVMAPAPIGESTSGDQLRVALPSLAGEGNGAHPGTSFPLGDLFSQAPAALVLSGQGYPVALQAGTSSFTGGPRIPLFRYQVLAGDSPLPLGTSWAWYQISGAKVLAADLAGEDAQQNRLFYSGIAFGVAAGALISLLVEVIPVESITGTSKRKEDAGPKEVRPEG